MKLTLATLLGISAAAASLHAELVQNGGFETGDLTGWTTANNFSFSGVATSVAGYLPHTGNYFLYFGPEFANGTLSQTITTVPGQTYDFSFWLAGNGTAFSELQASWNGDAITDISPIPNEAYTQYSFNELATGASTTISFSLRNDPYFDALDDVSVTPTAAPDAGSTMGLMGVAAAGLAIVRRKL